ncbi:MAG: M28 family peptidase [Erythrobacter sp.]
MSRHCGRLWGIWALLLALALAACARPAAPVSVPPAERSAIAGRLMQDITTLASDEFGGRKPGTIGEARTLSYLTARMQEIGLVSGTNDPGSPWRAPVQLVATLPQTSRIAFGNGQRAFVVPSEAGFAITPRRRELAQGGPATGVDVLLVGEEMADLTRDDVAGSVIILLARQSDAAAQRAALFEMDAGAVLTIVSDAAALAQIRSEYSEERVRLLGDEANTLSAFITEAAIEHALGATRWAGLKQQALAQGPVALEVSLSIEANSQRREFVSHNLIGMIPGKSSSSGAVLLLAHWDHLGECGPPDAEDRICNGAIDNASGVAVMLELARRLKAGPSLDRDIFVLATTAEEVGLLGARAFAAAPPVPLDQIIAAFNFDTVAVAPAGAPVGIVGRGRTPFEPIVLEHLTKTRRVLGNRDFAESFLARQDGWALLQQGVPTVLISSAFASREILGPYLKRDYHSASDTSDKIELGGAIDDLLLHEAVIRQLGDAARYQPPSALVDPQP